MARIAWLLEKGEEGNIEEYTTKLNAIGMEADFYRTPQELMDSMSRKDYDLLILGMASETEPFSNRETDYGCAVGLRLAEHIRESFRDNTPPILIESTPLFGEMSHYYGPELRVRGIKAITRAINNFSQAFYSGELERALKRALKKDEPEPPKKAFNV